MKGLDVRSSRNGWTRSSVSCSPGSEPCFIELVTCPNAYLVEEGELRIDVLDDPNERFLDLAGQVALHHEAHLIFGAPHHGLSLKVGKHSGPPFIQVV